MTTSNQPDDSLIEEVAAFDDPLDITNAEDMPYEHRLHLLKCWLARAGSKDRREVINAILILEGKAVLRDDEPDDAPRVRGYGVVGG